jgi:hypothetical protein
VVVGYSNTDWAGNVDDRKSTLGGCFYVRNNLVAWMSRKQSSISLSTTEAEYIAAGSCCTQLLWMKKLLYDYGFTQDTIVINCDNTSAINISKNPIQDSRTSTLTSDITSFMILWNPGQYLFLLYLLTSNWLTFLPNLLMKAGLSLLENPLVFVTCPRHVVSC